MTRRAAPSSPFQVARRERPAFTFIEILATMTLLAIVLPPTMEGISLSLSTAGAAKKRAEAASLAHSKLFELVAQGQWQHENLSGDFGPDWTGYRWTATASDWDGAVLRQLSVTVTWRRGGTDRSITLTTLVYTGEQL
jgi:prepilin-type N-terminal cleavage/methylation domain-containing protein